MSKQPSRQLSRQERRHCRDAQTGSAPALVLLAWHGRLPFLLLGLGLDQASRVLKWLKPHLGKIEFGTGMVLILVGVMIYFNWLASLNHYFTPIIRV